MRKFSPIQVTALVTTALGALTMAILTYQLHEMDAGWLPEFTTALTALSLFLGIEIYRDGELCD